jgi:hypothetical protein
MDEKQENLAAQYMQANNQHIQYCKECGCIIDNTRINPDEECVNSKNKPIKIFILNTLLLILSLCLVISIHKIYILTQNLQQMERVLQEEEIKIDGLNDELLKSEEEITFFNENCAIILDGSKVYHTYNCYFFQNTKNEYYIMTIRQAEDAGYRPCKKCHEINDE